MSDKKSQEASTPEHTGPPSFAPVAPKEGVTPASTQPPASNQPPQASQTEKKDTPSSASTQPPQAAQAAKNEKEKPSVSQQKAANDPAKTSGQDPSKQPPLKVKMADMPPSMPAIGPEGEPAPAPGSNKFTSVPRDTGERHVAMVKALSDGSPQFTVHDSPFFKKDDGKKYIKTAPTFADGAKITIPLNRRFWIGPSKLEKVSRVNFKFTKENLTGVGSDSLTFAVQSYDKKEEKEKYWFRYSSLRPALRTVATEMRMLCALSQDGGNRLFFPEVKLYHRYGDRTFLGTEYFQRSLKDRMQLVEVGMNLHCIRAVLKQLFEAVVAIRELGIKHPNLTPSSIRMRSPNVNDLRVVVTNFNHAYDKTMNVLDNDTSRFTDYTPIDLVFRSGEYEQMEEWSLGVIAFHLMTGYSPFYTLEKDDEKKTLQMDAIVYGAHALLDNPTRVPFGDRMPKWYEIQKDDKGKERSMLKLKDSAREERDKFLANRRPIKPWAQRITFGPLEEAKQWQYMSPDATKDRRHLVNLIRRLLQYRQEDRHEVFSLLAREPFFQLQKSDPPLSADYIDQAEYVLANNPDVIGDLWKALTMDATQGRSPGDPAPVEVPRTRAPAEEQAAPAAAPKELRAPSPIYAAEGDPIPDDEDKFSFAPPATGKRLIATISTKEDGKMKLSLVDHAEYNLRDTTYTKPISLSRGKMNVQFGRRYWLDHHKVVQLNESDMQRPKTDSVVFICKEKPDGKRLWIRYSSLYKSVKNVATEMNMLHAMSHKKIELFPSVMFYHRYQNRSFFAVEYYPDSLRNRIDMERQGFNFHSIRCLLTQIRDALMVLRDCGVKNPHLTPSSIRMKTESSNDLRLVLVNLNHACDFTMEIDDEDWERLSAYSPIEIIFQNDATGKFDNLEEWTLGVIALELMLGFSPFRIPGDVMTPAVFASYKLLGAPKPPIRGRMQLWYEEVKGKTHGQNAVRLTREGAQALNKFIWTSDPSNRREIVTFESLQTGQRWEHLSDDEKRDRDLLVKLIKQLLRYDPSKRHTVHAVRAADFFELGFARPSFPPSYISDAAAVMANDGAVIAKLSQVGSK